MRTFAVSLVVGLMVLCACGVSEGGTDKTLVAWVLGIDPAVRGGSVLTIQSGDEFDGIVFGEIAPGKWMAGSNYYNRTQKQQDSFALETATGDTLVQIAIVYAGDEIRVYRDGQAYSTHKAKNIDLLSPEYNIAVLGFRHIGASGGYVSASVEDARIYAKALTAREIQALRANENSRARPYAWWDFEDGKMVDRAGRFGHSRMKGGARIADGKLVLVDGAVVVAARTEDNVEVATREPGARPPMAPYVPETPAMPDDVPETWLTYHLAHPGPGVGVPGDPNPAWFHKGHYHLHYIYQNNYGFAFAHVSSKDLVTWKWHPTVLVPPNTGHGMFSGTGFFTKSGQPAMIYHGQGAGNNYIAFGLDDDLNEWTEPMAVKPKKADGTDANIRMWDPDCWLNGDTYYAISGGAPAHLMKSTDLKEWAYVGLLLHDEMPDLGVSPNEDVSCANMFRIGDKWMLLCISHELGCRYYLGDFKDEQYLPEFHAMMNWKRWDYFAPESLLTPDGRRVAFAWCRLEGDATQSAIQGLPRELSLPSDGVLRIKPLRELETLRYDEVDEGRITVRNGGDYRLKKMAGDTVELEIVVEPTKAGAYGVRVFCDEAGEGFDIAVKPDKGVFAMGDIEPPIELAEGEATRLRVFLDKSVVEVFVNDRQAAVYQQKHDADDVGICLFSEGGDIAATVKGWKMRSIYGR